jgi:hypothetical protein
MSQFDFGTIDPYVVDGVELADFLNQWRDALYSLHRGSTRPPYAVPGQLWINDSAGANAWVLQWYVSPTVGDVALFTLNTTTGGITISASAGGQFAAATLLAQAAANPQVQWNATGNPIDVKNWRMTTDGTGALVLASYSDAGVLQQQIKFGRDGSITPAVPFPAGIVALPCARFEVTNGWAWGLTGYIRLVPDKTVFNFGAGTMAGTGLWTPGAGLWRFGAGFQTSNNSGASPQVGCFLQKNGVAVAVDYKASFTGQNNSFWVTTTQQMAPTDTIEFGGNISGGGAENFVGSPMNFIEGFRLR